MTSTTQTHKRLERMRPTRLSLREERYNTKEMYNMGRGRTTSSKWSTSEAGWVGGGMGHSFECVFTYLICKIR